MHVNTDLAIKNSNSETFYFTKSPYSTIIIFKPKTL